MCDPVRQKRDESVLVVSKRELIPTNTKSNKAPLNVAVIQNCQTA